MVLTWHICSDHGYYVFRPRRVYKEAHSCFRPLSHTLLVGHLLVAMAARLLDARGMNAEKLSPQGLDSFDTGHYSCNLYCSYQEVLISV